MAAPAAAAPPTTAELRQEVAGYGDKFDQTSPRKMAAVGLHNHTGTLCYQNAVLQVLFHYPRFAHWLVQTHHHKRGLCVIDRHWQCTPGAKVACKECCTIPSCMLCRLKLMLDQYWTTTKKVDYSAFRVYRHQLRVLSFGNGDGNSDVPRFLREGEGGQQDAQQFFLWIMEVIDSNAYPNWTSATPFTSAFQSLSGMVSFTLLEVCQNDKCEINANHSMTLHQERGIMIDNGKEWQDRGLLDIMTTQFKNGFAARTCKNSACQKRGKKELPFRSTKDITGFPDLLPITLNHYVEKRSTYQGKKRLNHNKGDYYPEIPGFLDLTDLSGSHTAADDKVEYALYAVIAHMGKDNRFGHYKAVLKNAENQWIELSDRDIEELPFADKEKQLGRFPVPKSAKDSWYGGPTNKAGRWTPYVLFYRLVSKSGKPRDTRKRNASGSPEATVPKRRVRKAKPDIVPSGGS